MYARELLLRIDGTEGPERTSARSLAGWQVPFLRGLWQCYRAERKVQRWIRELQQCDDRILRDIGIPRCEIEVIVRGGGSAARPRG